MIAVDTSILVRFFVQDDAKQAALATELLEVKLTPSQPGFVAVVAIHESVWVLQRIYGLKWDDVRPIIAALLESPNLVIEHHDEVLQALSAPCGFADALIHFISRRLGTQTTFTFDKKFARLAGVELLR